LGVDLLVERGIVVGAQVAEVEEIAVEGQRHSQDPEGTEGENL
jgi:hypothetical protein